MVGTFMLATIGRPVTGIVKDECKKPVDKRLHKFNQTNMLTEIHPKLPMRDKTSTKDFYINKLEFHEFGSADFDGYLMVKKDNIQIHFFEFKDLDPKENYGQVYIRTDEIDKLYQTLLDRKTLIHKNGYIEIKPWGQKEFSVLDPDNNLLTFGQSI
jgi:hypothetical protein